MSRCQLYCRIYQQVLLIHITQADTLLDVEKSYSHPKNRTPVSDGIHRCTTTVLDGRWYLLMRNAFLYIGHGNLLRWRFGLRRVSDTKFVGMWTHA